MRDLQSYMAEALVSDYGGADNTGFLEYLEDYCYDLHYAPIPQAQPLLKFIRKIMRTADIAQTAETAALLELSAPLALLKQIHSGQRRKIKIGSNDKSDGNLVVGFSMTGTG